MVGRRLELVSWTVEAQAIGCRVATSEALTSLYARLRSLSRGESDEIIHWRQAAGQPIAQLAVSIPDRCAKMYNWWLDGCCRLGTGLRGSRSSCHWRRCCHPRTVHQPTRTEPKPCRDINMIAVPGSSAKDCSRRLGAPSLSGRCRPNRLHRTQQGPEILQHASSKTFKSSKVNYQYIYCYTPDPVGLYLTSAALCRM